MRSQIILGLFLSSTVTALSDSRGARGIDHNILKRQSGPVAPGTASDCTFYDIAASGHNTCQAFQSDWGLTFAQFFDYNPSVKADCSGIIDGNSYCVEVNFGLPRPGSTKSSTPVVVSSTRAAASSGPSRTATGTPKPSPTQAGLIESCTDFYFAVPEDHCNKIVALYGTFTYNDFVKWNPAVGADCLGIWAKTWYCVGIPGTPTKPSARPTTIKTSTRQPITTTPPCILKFVNGRYYCVEDPKDCNPNAPPLPQPSAICGCKKWHKVVENENCDTIVAKENIKRTQLNEWNPTINNGGDCKTLWKDYSVCVGI